MNYKEILIDNINRIHTTSMGIDRIKKNLNLGNIDVLEYCKNIILNSKSIVNKLGKNYYVELENNCITINHSSYTIITAHLHK